jgi:hypothetical protein
LKLIIANKLLKHSFSEQLGFRVNFYQLVQQLLVFIADQSVSYQTQEILEVLEIEAELGIQANLLGFLQNLVFCLILVKNNPVYVRVQDLNGLLRMAVYHVVNQGNWRKGLDVEIAVLKVQLLRPIRH